MRGCTSDFSCRNIFVALLLWFRIKTNQNETCYAIKLAAGAASGVECIFTQNACCFGARTCAARTWCQEADDGHMKCNKEITILVDARISLQPPLSPARKELT